MAKKRIVAKKIKKGKFYAVHEGSKKGHPGKLYWKNDNKNLYLFLRTGTTSTPENVKLRVPTEEGLEASYVYKKPVLAKRKDVEGEFPHLRFSKLDKKMLRRISEMPYFETPHIRKKDRQYMKRMKKKPRY